MHLVEFLGALCIVQDFVFVTELSCSTEYLIDISAERVTVTLSGTFTPLPLLELLLR
jgi:hypothetical protein